MVNPNFTTLEDRKQNAAKPKAKTASQPMPTPKVVEKTASWPFSGPTQTRNRSLGVAQVKIHPKKEGL